MATIDEQKYATEYTGLISTASLALGFITIFSVAFETFSRIPRNIARKKRPGHENEAPSVEDYTMAYLYRPRAFLGKNRGPQLPRWPLVWIWQVLRLPQAWYLKHAGLDAAVYIRFVTGCWFFVFSQLCTTLVITLPLHIIYAPDSVLPSSIAQASVSSLINSTSGGREYLWVRTVLLWWQTFCWISVVIYVGWGNIRMRREQILDPWTDSKDGDCDAEDLETQGIRDQGQPTNENLQPELAAGVRTRGWRFRTVKVSNIPLHMRNEKALRKYFDTCLDFLKRNAAVKATDARSSPRRSLAAEEAAVADTSDPPEDAATLVPTSNVDHVLVVRKLTELHELVKKRRAVLHELESAHVELARSVMAAVARRIRLASDQPSLREKWAAKLPRRDQLDQVSRQAKEDAKLDELVDALGELLPVGSREAELWLANNPEKRSKLPSRTIWEALAELPQEALDAYQPVVKLKFFRDQVVPSVDLYLTKLNLLTSMIEDLKTRAESYAACDTAFVTFKCARDARLIKSKLSWIRARGLTCRVRMAPDSRDLDWDKLVQANFRGDVVRAFFTHAGVWLGTFFWILPISALIGLVSLDNLSTRIPALARWLTDHAKAKSLASSLIPTVIVTITNMLIPTIMIQVSGRAQTFVTMSKLHHATWCRYWKWVIINVVIAFCAGTALFTSVLGIFTGDTFSETANNPLNIIASSFSNGAVFFVSYTILVIATQCFFELAQFMIPWFLYLGVRKATSPRQRLFKTEGRRFFSYTVAPNHTLIISVLLVFSLLNPLPICFTFIYFSIACVVFRDHFARLYWRVYYEQYGRMFYMRIMRYSLDALVLGQVVNMSLFFVLKDGKNGGACAALIPVTIFIKLVLTRWYDSHMDAADATFADVICGQGGPDSRGHSAEEGDETHAAHRSRRLSVNEQLARYQLPELTLRATLRLPLSGRGRATLKAKHGPQALLQRLTKRLQDADAYAELKDVAEGRRTGEKVGGDAEEIPSTEKTLQALETPTTAGIRRPSPSVASPERSSLCDILPHPRLQRDDRPDFSALYRDPYLHEPIERCLWLPRDPLYGIDLDDTIDWHGKALVSSEGGNGEIGGWLSTIEDEDNDQYITEERSSVEELLSSRLSPSPTGAESNGMQDALHFSRSVSASPMPLTPANQISSVRTLQGTERIRIPEELRSRYPSETQDESEASEEQAGSTFRRLSSPSLRRSTTPSRLPQIARSASAAQVLPPTTSTQLSPVERPEELRRVQSEILDTAAKQKARRPTLTIIPDQPQRDRSTSNATARSRNAEISQSKALAHEVISEERREAVARRHNEEAKALSRSKRARQAWHKWLFTPSEDVD